MTISNSQRSVSSLSLEERDFLKDGISKINDSMTRAAAEKDFVKDKITELTDKLGLDKKLLRKIAKTYYKASFNMDKADQSTFEEFYSFLFESK